MLITINEIYILQCKSPDEFRNSDTQLGDYKLFLLGGNHLIQAMKELKDEGINISRYVLLFIAKSKVLRRYIILFFIWL